MLMANLYRGLTLLLNKPMMGLVLLPPLYRCRNWGTERVNDLPQVPQRGGQVSNTRRNIMPHIRSFGAAELCEDKNKAKCVSLLLNSECFYKR